MSRNNDLLIYAAMSEPQRPQPQPDYVSGKLVLAILIFGLWLMLPGLIFWPVFILGGIIVAAISVSAYGERHPTQTNIVREILINGFVIGLVIAALVAIITHSH